MLSVDRRAGLLLLGALLTACDPVSPFVTPDLVFGENDRGQTTEVLGGTWVYDGTLWQPALGPVFPDGARPLSPLYGEHPETMRFDFWTGPAVYNHITSQWEREAMISGVGGFGTMMFQVLGP